jgi:hypothetical protein
MLPSSMKSKGRGMAGSSLHIVASDRAFARMLYCGILLETIRLFLLGRRPRLPRPASRAGADILVYAFDRNEMDEPSFEARATEAIRQDDGKVRIFLQLVSPEVHGAAPIEIDEKNRTIQAMALRFGAHFVAMNYILRMGPTRWMKKNGQPNLLGHCATAVMVLRTVSRQNLRTATELGSAGQSKRPIGEIPSARDLLDRLEWPHVFLPRNLDRSYPREAIGDFVTGIVSFPGWPQWGKFPLSDPIDWSMPGANWSWQSYFTGLEFLRPALNLAFDQVSELKISPNVLDALGENGTTADDVFRRISFIIADFVRNNPPAKPANQRAYFQGTMCRRIKALLSYLVVCKKRLQRQLPVDFDDVELAIQNLVHCFEMLQTDLVYPKGDNHGVRQDVLFILAGLLFPQLDYGNKLMRVGLERLERHQLRKALSPDGVWLENSFGYHCNIMNQLAMLLADLRIAGAPEARFIRDALARMLPFAEGLIKMDGSAPLIGDTAPSNHLSTIAGARKEIALADGESSARAKEGSFVRLKATYYFPQAGYFASYTGRELSAKSSSVVFTATLRNPKHKQSDDLSVIFSRGATDLLVDGGTFNKEISDSVRNAARHDPASHNTFRVNNGGYPVRVLPGAPPPGGLNGMWEGGGWAAARGFNHAYPDARITRIIIHLKEHNALIVFDMLASKTSNKVLFEQFWHVSPDFAPVADEQGNALTFSSKSQGFLSAAFEHGGPEAQIKFGSKENPIAWLMVPGKGVVPTPYIRRATSCQSGTMASLFQWTEAPADLAVAYRLTENGKFSVMARGHGFEAHFGVSEGDVTCSALQERASGQREFA